jgi:hypothetical protein
MEITSNSRRKDFGAEIARFSSFNLIGADISLISRRFRRIISEATSEATTAILYAQISER